MAPAESGNPGRALSLQNFDAAIIDLDGTLVDTLDDFVAALRLMLADVAPQPMAELERAVVATLVGKGSEHLVRSVLEHVGLLAGKTGPNTAVFDAAFASYQEHYRAINGAHSHIYPGALEGLQALQQAGLKLACLTNKPLVFALDLLRLKGLDGFFSQVFGGDSFERKKPDPLPLLKTCAALGTQAKRTLMVGDSRNDALAARAADCPVLLVTYGYNHGQPVRAVDADGFVDSLADLVV